MTWNFLDENYSSGFFGQKLWLGIFLTWFRIFFFYDVLPPKIFSIEFSSAPEFLSTENLDFRIFVVYLTPNPNASFKLFLVARAEFFPDILFVSFLFFYVKISLIFPRHFSKILLRFY